MQALEIHSHHNQARKMFQTFSAHAGVLKCVDNMRGNDTKQRELRIYGAVLMRTTFRGEIIEIIMDANIFFVVKRK